MLPLSGKIIVQRIAGEKQTSSGIILQKSEEVDRALVISVAQDVSEVETNDTILINWNAATKIGDSTYTVPITEVVFIYED